MTRHLLDTDCIIDYLLRRRPAVSLLRRLYEQGDDLCICGVVLAEIYSGLHEWQRAAAQELLDTLEFLPTDAATSIQAGEWRYRHRRQGQQLTTTDCLIAATAYANHATLVTGNIRDFPEPELSLLPLPKAP